jgi:hypothetical protein
MTVLTDKAKRAFIIGTNFLFHDDKPPEMTFDASRKLVMVTDWEHKSISLSYAWIEGHFVLGYFELIASLRRAYKDAGLGTEE